MLTIGMKARSSKNLLLPISSNLRAPFANCEQPRRIARINQAIKTVSKISAKYGKNKMSIFITFNIMRDPNTLESIQVEIGE